MTKKIYTIEEIRKKIKPVLDKTPVKTAILFGSYAKGEATPESDIDLLLDSEGKLRGFEFFGVAGRLEEKVKKPFDVFEVFELVSDGPIEKEVKKTGVKVYEKNL